MKDDDWIAFKKSFSQKQEEALWQYFLDHSRIQPNGYFGIMFYVKDVNDFWRRLHSRYTGDFTRYDVQEKEFKQALAISRYMNFKNTFEKNRINKILFWIYKKIYQRLFI